MLHHHDQTQFIITIIIDHHHQQQQQQQQEQHNSCFFLYFSIVTIINHNNHHHHHLINKNIISLNTASSQQFRAFLVITNSSIPATISSILCWVARSWVARSWVCGTKHTPILAGAALGAARDQSRAPNQLQAQ